MENEWKSIVTFLLQCKNVCLYPHVIYYYRQVLFLMFNLVFSSFLITYNMIWFLRKMIQIISKFGLNNSNRTILKAINQKSLCKERPQIQFAYYFFIKKKSWIWLKFSTYELNLWLLMLHLLW